MLKIANNFYTCKSINPASRANTKNTDNNSNPTYSTNQIMDLNKSPNAIAFKGGLTSFELYQNALRSVISKLSKEFSPDILKALHKFPDCSLAEIVEKAGGTKEEAIRLMAKIQKLKLEGDIISTGNLERQIEEEGFSALKQELFIVKEGSSNEAFLGKLLNKGEKSFEYVDSKGNRTVRFFDGDYDKYELRTETYNPENLLIRKQESTKSYGRSEYTNVHEYEYDAEKRLIKERWHTGDPVSSCHYIEYDREGREIRKWSEIDPWRNGNRSISYDYRYTYDSEGKPIKKVIKDSCGHIC